MRRVTKSVNIKTSLSVHSYNDQRQFGTLYQLLVTSNYFRSLASVKCEPCEFALTPQLVSYQSLFIVRSESIRFNNGKTLTNSLFPKHNPVKFELKRSPFATVVICPPLAIIRVTDDDEATISMEL